MSPPRRPPDRFDLALLFAPVPAPASRELERQERDTHAEWRAFAGNEAPIASAPIASALQEKAK